MRLTFEITTKMRRKSGNKRHLSPLWQRIKTLNSLKQIHTQIIIHGFLSNPFSIRELIFSSAITIPHTFDYARNIFDQIPNPDQFTFTTMIRAASHSSNPSLSLSLYSRMRKSISRSHNNLHLIFPFLFRASTQLSDISLSSQLHTQVVAFGLENDMFVRNSLINFHAKCGDIHAAHLLFNMGNEYDIVARSSMISGYAKRGELKLARVLFNESELKDLVSWNVMITAYASKGEMDNAKELFDSLVEKDTVSWNAMIAGYVKFNMFTKAMELFNEMQRMGGRPDEVTMLSLISGCSISGSLDIGRKLHCSLKTDNVSVLLGNALIDMYAKCGSIEKAFEVFRGMKDKDVSSWNSIIGGLALNGNGEEAIKLFEDMRKKKVRPDEITFVSVLVACSHGRMVDEGKYCFKLLKNDYGMEPNVKHCGCMVDILGRAGLLEEAFEFVDEMKMKKNPIIWRALLGACKEHGNVELGKRANEELVKMKEEESGSGDYVLLANIYAEKGEWERVERVRKLMDDSGLFKEAGSTQIEGTRTAAPIGFVELRDSRPVDSQAEHHVQILECNNSSAAHMNEDLLEHPIQENFEKNSVADCTRRMISGSNNYSTRLRSTRKASAVESLFEFNASEPQGVCGMTW